MQTRKVIIVVFTPVENADDIRKALGEAGAGKVGDYDFCSFSSRGIGRFRSSQDANPAIGKPGEYESVEEERIEVVVERTILQDVIRQVKAAHPYEEVPLYALPLLDIS